MECKCSQPASAVARFLATVARTALCLALAVAMAGCAAMTPTPLPTASPTASPTPVDTPPPSASPTPDATPTSTIAPTPSETLYVPDAPAFSRNGIDAAPLPSVRLPDRSWIPPEGLAAAPDWTGKTAYLTFDDGPSASRTLPVLSILQAYGIQATFFVIGSSLGNAANRSILLRAFEQGATIANHSYSHFGSYADFDAFKTSVERGIAAVRNVTGVSPDLFRFPGGSNMYQAVPLEPQALPWLASKGIRYFDWSTSVGDGTSARYYAAEELVRNAMASAQGDRVVVLIHDAGFNPAKPHHDTLNALPLLIRALSERGYRFAPITDATPAYHFRLRIAIPTPTVEPSPAS